MNEELCPQCGSEIKTIPAGTSRTTGRQYGAFQTCSNRNCNYKPPKAGYTIPPKQPTQAPVNPYQNVMDEKAKQIRFAQERKDESIKESRSITGAYTIVAALITTGQLKEAGIEPALDRYIAMLFNKKIDQDTGIVLPNEPF